MLKRRLLMRRIFLGRGARRPLSISRVDTCERRFECNDVNTGCCTLQASKRHVRAQYIRSPFRRQDARDVSTLRRLPGDNLTSEWWRRQSTRSVRSWPHTSWSSPVFSLSRPVLRRTLDERRRPTVRRAAIVRPLPVTCLAKTPT